MAFYLKLPERDNTQGWLARQTPGPRVAPLRLLRCLAPALRRYNSELCQFCPTLPMFCPLAIPQKPCYAPNTSRNMPRMRYFVLVI
nr:MAG TPA: hypothetical protein [Bacteriophage sp.]